MSDALSRESGSPDSPSADPSAQSSGKQSAGKQAGKQARKQVFIEKIFPVKLLNQQVYYEHGGNPFKGLHRWYSRKPLSFSRASVLGSILPADVSMEEFEYLLGLDKAQAGEKEAGKQKRWEKKLYKFPPTEDRLRRVHDLCEETWGERQPSVLDAFAGGGSIPFEAVRYGLKTFASDLNPVAVVTMKAAMEYPLRFGPGLQEDIDQWVKWVGDEAEKRLAEFFPSQEGETVENYAWAHTVQCPTCGSTIPLSPNWWLYKRTEKQNWPKWCAVKPISNLDNKRVDFQLICGHKGSGSTIQIGEGESYDPSEFSSISRGVGKCLNCGGIIEDDFIKSHAQTHGLGHQLYAVAKKSVDGKLSFRLPSQQDESAFEAARLALKSIKEDPEKSIFFPHQRVPSNTHRGPDLYLYGIEYWNLLFNDRQILSLITYSQILKEINQRISEEKGCDFANAVSLYLSLVFDRCVDINSRLSGPKEVLNKVGRASATHSLNIMWNYVESSGSGYLFEQCAKAVVSRYSELCSFLTIQTSSKSVSQNEEDLKIDCLSADELSTIPSNSLHSIVTDPPYYDSVRYGELTDFFYVWLRSNLLTIFPEIFLNELTDKDREAISNPGRFRNMGVSAEELANQDYEAKMALAFAEYHRVLRDDGVMTVQFNHKDSGAWDTLAKSLIDAGFEITASWAVSTENPQNLHQAQKNSVSSTVLLVCRKRDPDAEQAWWDDLRPELANLVEQRAPEFEANDISGIDLYLSAFGPALNVFSRAWPVLDSAGQEVRPEQAFAEARKAVANYRFRKLLNTDTAGFDPLTQWYILAWDAFRAREFSFDEARQLALAIGGFDVNDLKTTYKLLDVKGGNCKFLTPQQRLKKRAFAITSEDFTGQHLIDGLHAVIAIYQEEGNIHPVRRFLKGTQLDSNDMFMRAWEIALKVMPRIGDERKRLPEEKALADLWLSMDEIKAKVLYVQPELEAEGEEQLGLFGA